jgi:ubiquinone/menaquinone biosynthesis C-methylase UbiE
MPSNEPRSAEAPPSPPSMLDLIRLSPRRLFPPGGIELYRQIALLTGMSSDDEVLDVACGRGVSLEYFVSEFDVHGSGVDADPALIELAEARTRKLGIADRLQFQTGRPGALPYRDEIFDITVGEVGLASHCDPQVAVRELVRVTKPGGFVVLVQLVWKAPVDVERQRMLAEHLGARPRMVVEWKRVLREAGVVDVHSEDWSDAQTSFRATVAKPFPDFAELFSVGEKVGIMRRARRQWGWRGVWNAIMRERAVHRLLTQERILGLDLLRGRKGSGVSPEGDDQPSRASDDEPRPTRDGTLAPVEPERTPAEARDADPSPSTPVHTRGLPLFGGDEESGT